MALPVNLELDRLGIPFPLYKAPLETMNCYVGQGICSLEGIIRPHRFELAMGGDVIVSCPKCAEEIALDAHDGRAGDCLSCGTTVPFPPVHEGEQELAVCYQCLRAGHAAFTQDTEFGMVRWEDAKRGLTHGSPGLNPDAINSNGFDFGPPHEGNPSWRGVRVPSEMLLELVRTPPYSAIQGEKWMFHCGQVMPYLGQWLPDDFERIRPHDPLSLFAEMLEPDEDAEQLWTILDPDIAQCHVHGCQSCGKFRAFVDLE